jgi:hypothetical protein
MPRKITRRDAGRPGPDGAALSQQGERDQDRPAVGRRRLLTGGGVVMAGAVGAGVAAAAAAPASAQATTAVDMNTVNMAGTSATPTELDAANNTTPAFILKNTGVVTTTTPNGGGPALRLTPSAEIVPSSTTGGDLTTTTGGLLWFTHNFGGTPPAIIAAPVLTEATGNVYASLPAPRRILDTRLASGRTNIVNPSGNLDSSHRLLAGKTIFINLDSLVFFADAVFANITVTGMARSGWLLVWSGAGTRPTASTINFGTATLSNFLASSIAEFSTTILNVIAIITTTTTHVILDVAGFSTPGFEFAKFTAAATTSRNARLQRAQQAMRNANRA